MSGFISVPSSALRFNEGRNTVRDFLEVTNSGNALSGTGDWTIEAWVATTDTDNAFNRIVRMPASGRLTGLFACRSEWRNPAYCRHQYPHRH